MLSAQDNDLLTRTGPGTPMGEVFRRFWQPILLPTELPEPDCPPVRVRVLGEDLVAFRDSNGQVGFLAENCPHRGASLFFGRNEECGLRCVYHGWKFDVNGRCVDMPNEPPESNFKDKVRTAAYPAAERGNLIWIYMGPPDQQPPLPNYQWCMQPASETAPTAKWMQDCNYAQMVESLLDSSHVSFLHRTFNIENMARTNVPRGPQQATVGRETDFGFVYGARRTALDGQFNWRVTTFVAPNFTSVASTSPIGSGVFLVPADDEHCWWIDAWFTRLPAGEERDKVLWQRRLAKEDETTGLIPGTWRHIRNRDNDYLIDREMQRTVNFTGLLGNRAQDSAVCESMGPISDRTREHLGAADAGIIFFRRRMLEMARQLQQGSDLLLPKDPDLFRILPMDVLTTEGDFGKVWDTHYGAFLANPPVVERALPA